MPSGEQVELARGDHWRPAPANRGRRVALGASGNNRIAVMALASGGQIAASRRSVAEGEEGERQGERESARPPANFLVASS